MKHTKNKGELLILKLIIICCLSACGSQKKIISFYSKCFDLNSLDENIELYISREERKKILNTNKDFKKYKLIYMAFDKNEKRYYVELFDKKHTYFCLQIDDNYRIIKSEKHLMDI